MTIQDISRSVYELTRDFFKHTAVVKSANKRYAPGAPVGPLKYHWRLTGRHIAGGVVVDARDNYRTGRTPIQYGRWLHQQGAGAAGNCSEMSCLALYYFTRYAHHGDDLPFPVHMVGLDDPGDHAFLLVGYIPPSMASVRYLTSSSMPLRTFCHGMPEIAESYVVDVWAGIFCPTIEYVNEFPRKMATWGAQRKQVAFDGAWRDPGTVRYISSVLNSTFYLHDSYEPL